MFYLKAINGLFDDFLAQTVESYQGETPCLDEDAFIHCGWWLRSGELLELYRERCEQRAEPDFPRLRSEQRQQEQQLEG